MSWATVKYAVVHPAIEQTRKGGPTTALWSLQTMEVCTFSGSTQKHLIFMYISEKWCVYSNLIQS